jgi:hypothetical protein
MTTIQVRPLTIWKFHLTESIIAIVKIHAKMIKFQIVPFQSAIQIKVVSQNR